MNAAILEASLVVGKGVEAARHPRTGAGLPDSATRVLASRVGADASPCGGEGFWPEI